MRLPHALLSALLIQLSMGLSFLSTSAPANAQIDAVVNTASLPGRPLWSDLSEAQQQALAPLSEQWPTMNESHKRKWLAMSQNFPQLSEDEQAVLQSRMLDWAALSPRKRIAARLNFEKIQKLSLEEKKAKWEAYQALPPDVKRRLAAQQRPPASGVASVNNPMQAGKLVPPPAATGNKPLPRIATDQLAPVTLLPNAIVPAASAPASAPESTETPQ